MSQLQAGHLHYQHPEEAVLHAEIAVGLPRELILAGQGDRLGADDRLQPEDRRHGVF